MDIIPGDTRIHSLVQRIIEIPTSTTWEPSSPSCGCVGCIAHLSSKETPDENLFTDSDRSNIILFLAKCVTVIDPRVRSQCHVPAMYVASDGTNHYPGTDTLWSDKGSAMYDWMCNRMGFLMIYITMQNPRATCWRFASICTICM